MPLPTFVQTNGEEFDDGEDDTSEEHLQRQHPILGQDGVARGDDYAGEHVDAADTRVPGGDFGQCQSVHGGGMGGGVEEGEVPAELEVVFDQVAFSAGAVDADDARAAACSRW